MLITFFDIKGMLFLCEAVHNKRPELWPNDWILHLGSASADKTISVKAVFGQKIDYLNGTPILFPYFGLE
jgi:hypothetical protein